MALFRRASIVRSQIRCSTPAELALIIPGETIAVPARRESRHRRRHALWHLAARTPRGARRGARRQRSSETPLERWTARNCSPALGAKSGGAAALAKLVADRSANDIGPGDRRCLLDRRAAANRLVHRAAFVAESRPRWSRCLRGFAQEDGRGHAVFDDATPRRSASSVRAKARSGVGMARELMAPATRRSSRRWTECDEAARRLIDWSIIAQLAAIPVRTTTGSTKST